MGKSLAISILAAIGVLGAVPGPVAIADPTIQAEPTYCTGTNLGPEAGSRQDGKDTVQAATDIQCDQTQWVQLIYTITGDGNSWSDDIGGTVTSSGRLFTSPHHKVGGDLNGQLYTVKTQVKVWSGSSILCGGGANCYPFGTPLRVFNLPDITEPVYD